MTADIWDFILDDLDPLEPQVPGWEPQPKQKTAETLADTTFELLYGGAAGGGKSYWLRNMAVRDALKSPGSHIGIVRKTLPMLKQTHMNPLIQICHGIATLNRSENFWHFKNGSVIRFISLNNKGDEQNYKSVEFDSLYFDEVTELEEEVYTFMLTRLRSANGHRTHVCATANPEGRGFVWVKRRWVKPQPNDLAPNQKAPEALEVWHPPIPNMTGVKGRSRVFIPATIKDNPALIEANPDYELQLMSQKDPRMVRALLNGDWDAMDKIEGAFWSHSLIELHRVPVAPDITRKVLAIDPATTSNAKSDHTGIILASLSMQDVNDFTEEQRKIKTNRVAKKEAHYYVEKDFSTQAPSEEWARLAIEIAVKESATIVYESDQGGDAWRTILKNSAKFLGVSCPRIISVRAGSVGSKAVRANPIAALYHQGRVHHVGALPQLEEQMTTWVPEDSKDSPDRIDALVWAIRQLDTKTNTAPIQYGSMY